MDVSKAYEWKSKMIEARIASGDIRDNPEKRRAPREPTEETTEQPTQEVGYRLEAGSTDWNP